MRSKFSGLVVSTLLAATVYSSAGFSASITGPSSNTTGTFTLSWTSGHYLAHADASTPSIVAGAPATSYTFADLPSGVYRFVLGSCFELWDEGGQHQYCDPDPSTEKTVTVTRDAEPALDTATTEAGTPAYTAGVNLRGSSTISIPLKTISGVNGIAPHLSLEYESARGTDIAHVYYENDLLDYGWSLRGLSKIHFCWISAPTKCLDGMPLKRVTGSGGVGSVYHTESQTQVQVTQLTLGYEVRYPDGSVGRFGDTAATSGGLGGYTISALRQLTGPLGDVMTVSYEKYDPYGSFQPKTVSYSGATVDFKYGPRDDLAPLASGRRTGVLNKVLVSLDGTPVREYRLDSNLVGNRLRLERLQECGYSPSGTLDACLAPLTFAWTGVSGGTTNYPIAIASVTDAVGKKTEYLYSSLTATSNPLNYSEAPFGATMAVANITAQSLAPVAEMKVSDGLTSSGRRRFTYSYKGLPYRSSVGRGFIGFYELRQKDEQSGIYTYTQTRLDFPFLNVVSQRLSINARFGSHTQTLHREEHAFNLASQAGGVVYPTLARASTRLAFEGNTTVSAEEETLVLCFKELVDGTCTGTSSKFPTRLTVTREVADDISNPTFAAAFWGDVPDRAVLGSQHTTVTTTDFANATGTPWVIGSPVKRTVQATAAGESSRTTTQTASYFGGTREPAIVTNLQGAGASEYTLSRTLGGGSPNYLSGTTLSGASIASRDTSWTVTADHRYPSAVTNALGQTTNFDYDARFGAVSQVSDPDGNLTRWSYDAFGRRILATSQDGTEVAITYQRCDVADCSAVVNAEAAFKVTHVTSNGAVQTAPTSVSYHDVLGRVVLTEVEALSSADGWRRQRTEYDNRNRVKSVSIPYFSTQPTPTCIGADTDCTWYTYDLRDRITGEDRPDGGSTATSYVDAGAAGAVTVTVTETIKQIGSVDATRVKQSTFNALGQLIASTDAVGSASAINTNYDYDSHGNLDEILVDGVAMATMSYDLAGNRTALTDANVGRWTFDYDALRSLTRTVDAKRQETRYSFDLLNRVTQRVDRYGTGDEVTNNWTWDAPYGTGQLASRSSPGFSETYSYRAADGKLESVDTEIDVFGVHSGSYSHSFGYDAHGRLETVGYPSGNTFTTAYDSRGHATQVKSGSTVLESVQDTDAFGQATVTSFANDLKTIRGYDAATGRLTSIQTGPPATPRSVQDLEYQWRSNSTLYKRIDKRDTTGSSDDYSDTFSYDALERVIAQSTSGGATRTLSFGYDAYGNLTSKTSTASGDLDVTGYAYALSGKPHRLTAANIGGVANTLSYDSNGSITRYDAATGDDIDLAYDGQNRVTSITIGTTPAARDEFWYDPDGQRFLGRETWQDSGIRTAVTVYLGSFEEVFPAAGGSHDRIQRTDLTATVRQIRTRTTAGNWASRFEYVHRDHLGSVNVITDMAGARLNDKTSHDPFGGRRAATWASDISTTAMALILANEDERFARGYTDHEQLNRTGFIHMNGRVYDPRIGRFVSADPIVQAPFHSQSYNRYSYTFNSPLSFIDPSGYECDVILDGALTGFCGEPYFPRTHAWDVWNSRMWSAYLGATDFNGAGGGGVDEGAYQPPDAQPSAQQPPVARPPEASGRALSDLLLRNLGILLDAFEVEAGYGLGLRFGAKAGNTVKILVGGEFLIGGATLTFAGNTAFVQRGELGASLKVGRYKVGFATDRYEYRDQAGRGPVETREPGVFIVQRNALGVKSDSGKASISLTVLALRVGASIDLGKTLVAVTYWDDFDPVWD